MCDLDDLDDLDLVLDDGDFLDAIKEELLFLAIIFCF
jgi:hypothetical protein